MAHYCPRHGGMERQRSLQILGLSRDATTEEINQSYRRLAREHHPDKNNNEPEATRKFQEINRAYQYLTKDAESSDDEFESPFHQRRRFYFDDDDDDDEPFSFFGPSVFSMFMQELLFERMIRQMFARRQAESQRRHDFHGWRHSYHDDDDLPPWARRNPPPRPSWERRSSSPRPSWERRSPSPRPSWERRSPSPRPSWERRNPSSSPSHNTNQSSRRSTWSSDSTQPSTSHDHRESSTQQNSTKRKGNQSSGKSSSSSGATKKSRRRQARKEKRLQKLIAKERRRQDEDMARRMTSMNL